jgi:hypothetical protein
MLVPKYKNSDAGNSDITKRIHKLLPLDEKVEVPDFNKEKNSRMLRLLRSIVRTSSYKTRKKKFMLVLLLYLKL